MFLILGCPKACVLINFVLIKKNTCIYIFKDLRLKTWDLRSNESRDQYHEDVNLASPRRGFGFEAAFQL